MRPARAPLREKWQARARGYASQAQDQLAVAWRKLIEAGETSTAQTPANPVPALAPPAETAAGEPLSARLQELESVFSPTTHSSAHPRELSEQPQFQEAVALLKAPGVPLDTVLQYALGANWALASAALAALKQRAGRRAGRRRDRAPFRQALSLADALRARVFRRRAAAAADRCAAAGCKGLVVRQCRHSDAVSRLLCRARATGRRAAVWRRRAAGCGGRDRQSLARAHLAPLREGVDQSPAQPAADDHRPGIPHLVRALLEGRQGHAGAGGARAVARRLDGSGGDFAGGAGAFAAGQRRASRGQDLVPAAAGQAPGSQRLDRVRGQRRRSDGGPEMVRRARGPHPAGAARAGRDEESHLVHSRHPADRTLRHASGPGRQHPRPDPAGHHRGAPGDLDGSLARQHRAACCACGRPCAA